MSDGEELLYFDTFAHGTTEELNLDLVQFPKPVYINQVRVVPLGAKVQADFPGGVRLGATNPSQFKLELFVNDLSKPGASAFENLGVLEYNQNSNIHFDCEKKVPTDGLVLRGWYTTVTLAVYGVITRAPIVSEAPAPPTPPKPSSPIQTPCVADVPDVLPLYIEEKSLNSTPLIEERTELLKVVEESPQIVNIKKEEEPEREPKQKNDDKSKEVEKVSEKWKEENNKTKRSDETRSRDSSEYRERINPEKSSKSDHRSRHEADRSKTESERSRSDSDKHRPDSDRHRSDPERSRAGESERTKTDRVESDRNRNDSDRHKNDRSERDRDRRKDRSRERERRKDRSPRDKERTKERDTRRPRTPPSTVVAEEKKSSPESTTIAADSGPPEVPIKKEEGKEALFECFSPGDMEAISDDDMPEVDNVLVAQNVGDVEPEAGSGKEEDEPAPVNCLTVDPVVVVEENEAALPDSTDTLVISESMETDQDQEELEEILSDEDLMFEEYSEMDLDMADFGEDIGKSFNPYGIELQPLQSLPDPATTSLQRTVKNLNTQLFSDRKEIEEAGSRLQGALQLTCRGEKWIESMGHVAVILSNALAYLQSTLDQDQLESVHDKIIEWVLDGLDFERARQQVPSTHTVRQIKCGLNLSLAIGQSCSSLLTKAIESGILSRIMTLYCAPHMALSLKLMCLRSLDILLGWPLAIDHFLKRQFLGQSNGYSYLIQLVEGSQPSRAQVSLVSLVKKIHVYEALEKVHDISLIVAHQPAVRKETRRPSGCQDSNSLEELRVHANSEANPIEPHLSQLACSLYDILKVYRNPKTIGHLTRFLPVQHQFEIASVTSEPLQGLYSYMQHHRFLSGLLLLINPLSGSDLIVVDVVLQFLEEFGKTQHGLCFLSSNPEATSLILRTLMHLPPVQQQQHDVDDSNVVDEFNASSASSLHRVGVQLAHSLYIIHCLDVLNFQVLLNGKDTPSCTDCLQSLHSLVFSISGRLALIDVLSLENNLDVLISILTADSDVHVEARLKESAVRGYAAELVALVVRFTDNAAFYGKYGPVLHGLVHQEVEVDGGGGAGAGKLAQLVRWVDIINNPQMFSLAGLTALCDTVKQHVEEAQHFPPELIVALRLMRPLAIPAESTRQDEYVELKYTYAVVHLFNNDMLSVLVNVLLKLCQAYEQPAVQSPILAGPQGSFLLSIIQPALKLVHCLLSQVIRCRDSDYRDLVAVPILLQTFALVNAVPQSSLMFHKASDCCCDIIATLLAYTQPLPQTSSSSSGGVGGGSGVGAKSSSAEEALSRSLWTQMVQEILKYMLTCSGPAAFITGLQILNEILPLPLPLASKSDKLDAEDGQEILNARKLWSVHLHTLSSQLHQVVTMLCCAGSQLLQILRKVCIQIADLSASMALVIARAAVDAILTSCLPENPSVQDDKSDAGGGAGAGAGAGSLGLPAVLVCPAHTARVLNFLTGVVTHPSLKAAVLQLCRGSQKSDEKYVDFLQILCLILNTASSAATHIQAQESVVTIFQSLLDADICLLSSDRMDYETYLSAALPSKDPTMVILSGLWDHLVGSHSYSSLLPTLRTLMMLTEHNYTFQHMQKILERKDQGGQGSLWPFFSKMASGFSKDSSDCLSTLSTALELVRLMLKTQSPLKDYKDRSLTLSLSSLAAALQWSSTEPPHPLVTLYDQLQSAEEGSTDSLNLKDSLSALIAMLQAGTEPLQSSKEAIPETILPPPETLNLQFSQRPLLDDVRMLDDERLSSIHWITSQWIDEADMEMDQIRCDLLETSELCINARIDLVAETERLCKSHTELSDQAEKTPVAGTTVAGSGHSTAGFLPPGRAILSTARDKSSKPYVAPMRGRGFGRPGVNSRNDPFRSRAPNTSRPPSLHVDDFVALEKNGSVPTAGSGSNNTYGKTRLGGGATLTTRGGRLNRGGRGGGFGAGERGGGRFVFTPRRDPSGRSPRIATANRPSASSAKWEDYHPATGDGRTSSTASRFQSTNRVWTNPKDRYPPSVSSSASRTSRHARTFTR